MNASSGYNLTDLDPYSRYAISVVILNKDSESPRSEEFFATTVEEGKNELGKLDMIKRLN